MTSAVSRAIRRSGAAPSAGCMREAQWAAAGLCVVLPALEVEDFCCTCAPSGRAHPCGHPQWRADGRWRSHAQWGIWGTSSRPIPRFTPVTRKAQEAMMSHARWLVRLRSARVVVKRDERRGSEERPLSLRRTLCQPARASGFATNPTCDSPGRTRSSPHFPASRSMNSQLVKKLLGMFSMCT